ncbi:MULTISPECIES: hypothetical protein [unclassified Xanthobacter]|uniref:hypothetical protein n=1 Tax=unclassified Xanthobacter TaxID=2623496 RepID=UPI001F187188|nr:MULTISPECIES: hypothetical protein [unclassified Xanthobacter]
MSKMQKVLERFDTKELARHGDPACYRRRAAGFLALYDQLRGGEAFTTSFAGLWLDALSRVDGNLLWDQRDAAAHAMVVAMKAELPCYPLVAAQFAKDMERLYSREERTRGYLGDLQAAARFEMARLRIEMGWMLPGLHPEWRHAKRMYDFSREKLQALWDEAHPQPKVKMVEKHIHHTNTVYQPAPMVVPGPNGKFGGF